MRSHQERLTPGLRCSARYAALGFGLGLAWGAGAEAWGHLLTTEPHGGWRRSLATVACAGLAGALVGVAYAAGRHGAPRSWRALTLPAAALFLGPGLLFLPAFLVGGWGLRRGPVGRRGTALSVAAAPAALAQTLWQRQQEGGGPTPDASSLLGLAVLTTLLAAASAWAGSAAFGPRAPHVSCSSSARRTASPVTPVTPVMTVTPVTPVTTVRGSVRPAPRSAAPRPLAARARAA